MLGVLQGGIGGHAQLLPGVSALILVEKGAHMTDLAPDIRACPADLPVVKEAHHFRATLKQGAHLCGAADLVESAIQGPEDILGL